MDKKIIFSSLALMVLNIYSVKGVADSFSEVTGKISSGELKMTNPQNILTTVKLSGSSQIVELPKITTEVTDFRGLNSGWYLSVKADNQVSFKQYMQLFLKSEIRKVVVNQSYQTLDEKQNQNFSVTKHYFPSLQLSQETPAKEYTIQLSWLLSPAVSISE